MEAPAVLIGIAFGLAASLPTIALVWLVTRQPVIDATWREADRNDQRQIEATK